MVASATHPKLDSDVVSTLDHAHEAEHTTGNEGWDPSKVKPLNVEWSNTF